MLQRDLTNALLREAVARSEKIMNGRLLKDLLEQLCMRRARSRYATRVFCNQQIEQSMYELGWIADLDVQRL